MNRELFDKFMTKVKSANDWQDSNVPNQFWSPSLRMRVTFATSPRCYDNSATDIPRYMVYPFSIHIRAGRTFCDDDQFTQEVRTSSRDGCLGKFHEEFRNWAAGVFTDRMVSNLKAQHRFESWIEEPSPAGPESTPAATNGESPQRPDVGIMMAPLFRALDDLEQLLSAAQPERGTNRPSLKSADAVNGPEGGTAFKNNMNEAELKRWEGFRTKLENSPRSVSLGECSVQLSIFRGQMCVELMPTESVARGREVEGIILPVDENECHLTSLMVMAEQAKPVSGEVAKVNDAQQRR